MKHEALQLTRIASLVKKLPNACAVEKQCSFPWLSIFSGNRPYALDDNQIVPKRTGQPFWSAARSNHMPADLPVSSSISVYHLHTPTHLSKLNVHEK